MQHISFINTPKAVHELLVHMWACGLGHDQASEILAQEHQLAITPAAWQAFNALIDAEYDALVQAQMAEDEANTVTLYIWPCGTWTDDEGERDELLTSKSDDYDTVKVIHRPGEPFEVLEDAVQQYLDGWAMKDIHDRLEAF